MLFVKISSFKIAIQGYDQQKPKQTPPPADPSFTNYALFNYNRSPPPPPNGTTSNYALSNYGSNTVTVNAIPSQNYGGPATPNYSEEVVAPAPNYNAANSNYTPLYGAGPIAPQYMPAITSNYTPLNNTPHPSQPAKDIAPGASNYSPLNDAPAKDLPAVTSNYSPLNYAPGKDLPTVTSNYKPLNYAPGKDLPAVTSNYKPLDYTPHQVPPANNLPVTSNYAPHQYQPAEKRAVASNYEPLDYTPAKEKPPSNSNYRPLGYSPNPSQPPKDAPPITSNYTPLQPKGTPMSNYLPNEPTDPSSLANHSPTDSQSQPQIQNILRLSGHTDTNDSLSDQEAPNRMSYFSQQLAMGARKGPQETEGMESPKSYRSSENIDLVKSNSGRRTKKREVRPSKKSADKYVSNHASSDSGDVLSKASRKSPTMSQSNNMLNTPAENQLQNSSKASEGSSSNQSQTFKLAIHSDPETTSNYTPLSPKKPEQLLSDSSPTSSRNEGTPSPTKTKSKREKKKHRNVTSQNTKTEIKKKPRSGSQAGEDVLDDALRKSTTQYLKYHHFAYEHRNESEENQKGNTLKISDRGNDLEVSTSAVLETEEDNIAKGRRKSLNDLDSTGFIPRNEVKIKSSSSNKEEELLIENDENKTLGPSTKKYIPPDYTPSLFFVVQLIPRPKEFVSPILHQLELDEWNEEFYITLGKSDSNLLVRLKDLELGTISKYSIPMSQFSKSPKKFRLKSQTEELFTSEVVIYVELVDDLIFKNSESELYSLQKDIKKLETLLEYQRKRIGSLDSGGFFDSSTDAIASSRNTMNSAEEIDISGNSAGASNKDWNSQFQSLLNSKDSTKKFSQLAGLARDFSFVAETYGRIIISEQYVKKKKIEPVDIGGYAGGKKYICQNILFKFATDMKITKYCWFYGGTEGENTEKAMKATGNELKALSAFFEIRVPKFCFPLMAIINYMGYSLSAASILPINKNTLIYGSADGGATVQTDPEVDQLMSKVGEVFNLSRHRINRSDVELVGPGDLEIHKGTDNKYYVVDLGRLMPPEAFTVLGNRPGQPIYYDLLRPIFVQRFKGFKLCSDSYSSWDHPTNAQKHKTEIEKVTRHLHTYTIKQFVHFILKTYTIESPTLESSFIRNLHLNGLNCRHLGIVFNKFEEESKPDHLLKNRKTPKRSEADMKTAKMCKQISLTECVARTMKNQLRKELRETMKQERILKELAYLSTAYKYLKNKISWIDGPTTLQPISGVNIPPKGAVEKLEFRFLMGDIPIKMKKNAFFYFEFTVLAEITDKNRIMLSLAQLHPSLAKLIPNFDKGNTPNPIEYTFQFWSFGYQYSKSGDMVTQEWSKGNVIGLLIYESAGSFFLEFFHSTTNLKMTFHPDAEYWYYPLLMYDKSVRLNLNFGREPFHYPLEAICNRLNLTERFKLHQRSNYTYNFWTQEIKEEIKLRFPQIILDKREDLRSKISRKLFFERIQEYCGIQFSSNYPAISAGERFLKKSDLIHLTSSLKQMNVIEYSEAVTVLLKFEMNPLNTDVQQLITAEYQLAENSVGQVEFVRARDYYYWGCLCLSIYKAEPTAKNKHMYLIKAKDIFENINFNDREYEFEENYRKWFDKGFNEVKQKVFFRLGDVFVHLGHKNAKVKYKEVHKLNPKFIENNFTQIYNIITSHPSLHFSKSYYEEMMVQFQVVQTEGAIPFFKFLLHHIELIHHHNSKPDGSNQDVQEIASSVAKILELKNKAPSKKPGLDTVHRTLFTSLYDCICAIVQNPLSGWAFLFLFQIVEHSKIFRNVMEEVVRKVPKLSIVSCPLPIQRAILGSVSKSVVLKTSVLKHLTCDVQYIQDPSLERQSPKSFEGKYMNQTGRVIDVIILPYFILDIGRFYITLSDLKEVNEGKYDFLGVCEQKKLIVFSNHPHNLFSKKIEGKTKYDDKDMKELLGIIRELILILMTINKSGYVLVDLILDEILLTSNNYPIIFNLLSAVPLETRIDVNYLKSLSDFKVSMELNIVFPPEKDEAGFFQSSWDVFMLGRIIATAITEKVTFRSSLGKELEAVFADCLSPVPQKRPALETIYRTINNYLEGNEKMAFKNLKLRRVITNDVEIAKTFNIFVMGIGGHKEFFLELQTAFKELEFKYQYRESENMFEGVLKNKQKFSFHCKDTLSKLESNFDTIIYYVDLNDYAGFTSAAETTMFEKSLEFFKELQFIPTKQNEVFVVFDVTHLTDTIIAKAPIPKTMKRHSKKQGNFSLDDVVQLAYQEFASVRGVHVQYRKYSQEDSKAAFDFIISSLRYSGTTNVLNTILL